MTMRVFLVALWVGACAPAQTGTPKPTAGEHKTFAEVGLSAEALDKLTDPCTDFYRFACGGWLDATEIPGDQARWSRGFSEVRARNRETLKKILEGDTGKIGTAYSACMDTDAIEAGGLEAFEAEMAAVERALKAKGIEAAVAQLHKHRVWAIFDISATQDFKDATTMLAYLDQNGLGLPDRDFYLEDAKKPIREEYEKHVVKMLELSGWSAKKSAAGAKDVMAIEHALAKASMPRVERRNPYNVYNKKTKQQLKELAGAFWWEAYFKGVGLESPTSVNVMTPEFFKGFDALLQKITRDQWLTYFRWHMLRAAAATSALPEAFLDEQFRMRAILTGAKRERERWKRCTDWTDRALGELVGQIYVEQKFAGRSKEDAIAMVNGISSAFETNLGTLDWMDADTRVSASTKREMMVYKIGYPSDWRIYTYDVGADHLSNVLAAASFETQRDLNKIGKPVNRKEWFMSPATVNAYYNPLLNEMVFPAGILQSPFYSVDAHVPVNLGAMGMIVGHELTHGFDDGGAKFAGDGNLTNWWQEDTAKKFEDKTKCVSEQYSKYEPVEGVFVNGDLTLGENIADIGGVKMAYSAYRALRKDATDRVVAEGYNEDQQFFLGLAQAWCAKARDEYTMLQVKTDPHSPAQYRVNGSLVNIPEFGEAFNCAEGSPMRPVERCEVW